MTVWYAILKKQALFQRQTKMSESISSKVVANKMGRFCNSDSEIFDCCITFYRPNARKAQRLHRGGAIDFEGYKSKNNRCDKRDGHDNYIEFNHLRMSHFLEPFRHKDMVQLTKKFGNLVVKLEVLKSSPHRPKYFPGTNNKYPTKVKCGTGRVVFSKTVRSTGYRHCSCDECKSSGHRRNEWGEIRVVTAAHVVFDELEVQNTICTLRYNKENATRTISFKGLRKFRINVEHDRSDIVFVTHDLNLVNLVRRSIYSFRDQHDKVYNKCKDLVNPNLVITVSHPHGWPKQVSIGTYERKEVGKKSENEVYTKYNYHLTTCRGSSGAPLYFLGKKDVWTMHPHSGDEGTALGPVGTSGIEWERVSQ